VPFDSGDEQSLSGLGAYQVRIRCRHSPFSDKQADTSCGHRERDDGSELVSDRST